MRWTWLLLVLAILPLSFATILTEDTLNLLLAFVIFLVTVLLALTLMMSKSFSLPQLEAWTKTELRELLVAAALFVIINSIFFGTSGLVELVTGQDSPEDTARTFLEQSKTQTENGYKELMLLMHHITMRSGFSALAPATPTPIVYLTFMASPYSGYSVLLAPLNMAAQGLTNAWFAYAGVLTLFEFALQGAAFVLPIGFIFRFIPFTRSLGTSLLALALGGKILLPIAVVIVAQFHGMIDVPDLDVPAGAISDLDISLLVVPFQAICSVTFIRFLLNLNETLFGIITCLPIAWIPGAFEPCRNIMTWIVFPIIDWIFRFAYAIYFAAIGLFGPPVAAVGTSGAEAADIVYDFLIDVNNFVLVAYVESIFIALIAYVGTKSISGALGGEQMMPAVSRLVR